MLLIKEVAKSKGITLNDLANKLGITYQALNARITGNPTIKILLEISEALDCDVKDLLENSKPTNKQTIYIKENNTFKEVGTLDIGKIQ